MEFVRKGFSGIFVTSEESRDEVLSFWRTFDEFEFDYLYQENIHVVSEEDLLDDVKLSGLCGYNGKFDGNIRALFSHFLLLDKKVKVIVGYDHGYGSIEYPTVYCSYDFSKSLSDKVADLIVDHVDIREFALEHYKNQLSSPALTKALYELFEKSKLSIT